MEITWAEPRDADALTGIAFAAKRHWGYPERWIAAWRDALTITPEYVRRHEVHVATVKGEAVAFYALEGTGGTLELGHLWVLPESMGSGIGRALFEHALDRAYSLDAAVLEIESDPNAERFYRLMGARRVGETASEVEDESRTLPLLAVDVPARYRLRHSTGRAAPAKPRSTSGGGGDEQNRRYGAYS